MEPRRWPLVGRDDECEAVVRAVDAERPSSVVIAGPAGVGRTRLLQEALSLMALRGRPTRWAAGATASAAVSLGALAPLLPAIDAAPGSLALLQRATQALAEGGPGQQPVLCVDDAHLLDPMSVTVLQQLATGSAATLVLAVRTSHAEPHVITHLWKDGLATRIDLQPLPRHHTERLISSVLTGDVETRTAERLWRLSEGIPLYVRELVDAGLRSGQLERSHGLWRWAGGMVPSQRLAEIVVAQLGRLDASEWRALEVLATAGPIRLREVAELSSPEAVASLQRRGVMTDAHTGRHGEVQAAHPLLAEVVRSRVPEAELRSIRQQLAARTAASGSVEELVERGELLLDGGLPAPDPGVLATAAQRAVAMLDHPLAERLARAGIDAGGGARAHLALIEAARWQGQSARSEQLAAEAESAAVSDDERARLTATRVLTLSCGLGRAEDAAAVLQQAAATIRSSEGRALLTSTDAVLAFLNGDPQRAVQLATPVLASNHGSTARSLAAAAAAAGLAMTGQTTRALATAEVGWSVVESQPEGTELAFVRIALAQAEVFALQLGGRIQELEARTAELYHRNLSAPEWAGDAVACLHRGWAALARGRAPVAIRWLGEALADLEQRDPAGLLGLCRSLAAIARALLGDAAGARELLSPDNGRRWVGARAYEPYARLAAAWLAAAEGHRADAAALALGAADLAAEQGQSAVEVFLLHNALRFGREPDIVERLQRLALRVDSAMVDAVALRARATVTGSGDALDLASRRFEDLGASLSAAEAAAEAAAAHERAGRRQAAVTSRTRAALLARDCGLSDTPAVEINAPPALTSREEEVARLAVLGLTNQAIADRLVLSVRTVEAHLAHVYAKLGVNGRAALAPVLARS